MDIIEHTNGRTDIVLTAAEHATLKAFLPEMLAYFRLRLAARECTASPGQQLGEAAIVSLFERIEVHLNAHTHEQIDSVLTRHHVWLGLETECLSEVRRAARQRAEESGMKYVDRTVKTAWLLERNDYKKALEEALEKFHVRIADVHEWGVILYDDKTIEVYGWR
jgi:hypothetical protein